MARAIAQTADGEVKAVVDRPARDSGMEPLAGAAAA
jgi:hypothetical protein